jgi:predicted nucleotidyltransferase
VILDDLLVREREGILRIAAQHGATNVRVFGSVARGEDEENSDVDFLVQMELGRSVFDLAALTMDLEELLSRRVDVVPDDGIYWLLRRRILNEAQPL